jgi:hypothetical protein
MKRTTMRTMIHAITRTTTRALRSRGCRMYWFAAAATLACSLVQWPAGAQTPGQAPATWEPESANRQGPPPANTTMVPRTPAAGKASGAPGQVALTAFLTDTSPAIAQGLVWRVFREKAASGGKAQLVSTVKEASPTVRLEPGTYRINVALGRANLTRKVAVVGDQLVKERFVLNAGGLRIVPVLTNGERVNAKLVTYDVESDDRDEYGQRVKVVTGARAGLVLRLNAGNYSVVSTYGDANASARADVSVEAGKLSEVTLAHAAARVSFKLVTRSGGDAIADTQWRVVNEKGKPVKESSGALPTHILAPGTYVVRATHAGRVYRRDFAVKAGDNVLVEVVMP